MMEFRTEERFYDQDRGETTTILAACQHSDPNRCLGMGRCRFTPSCFAQPQCTHTEGDQRCTLRAAHTYPEHYMRPIPKDGQE